MKTLSEFLTGYLKIHLFNGASLDKPETFDEMLERILSEGIFKYRKNLISTTSATSANGQDSPAFKICNALINVEDKVFTQFMDKDNKADK